MADDTPFDFTPVDHVPEFREPDTLDRAASYLGRGLARNPLVLGWTLGASAGNALATLPGRAKQAAAELDTLPARQLTEAPGESVGPVLETALTSMGATPFSAPRGAVGAGPARLVVARQMPDGTILGAGPTDKRAGAALAGIGHNGGPPLEPPSRVSTRLPTGMRATEDPMAEDRLIIDAAAMKQTPELYEHNVGLTKSYPGIADAGGTETHARSFIDHVKDNLRFLYNQAPDEVRARSKLWYDGGRRLADELAENYDVHPNSSAAAIASLSPQKDWFQNVSLAHRVHEIHFNQRNKPWTPEMQDTAGEIFGKPQYKPLINAIRGKTYSELENPVEKAAWLRIYDETYFDKAHHLITPEGYAGDLVRKAPTNKQKNAGEPGDPAKVAWGSNVEISKAIQALEANGDVNKITPLLGERHKVRNFYNNIIDPNAPHGDVTIDTHAVAAGLLRPLSGNAVEVAHNFANGLMADKYAAIRAARPDLNLPDKFPGAKSSSLTGVQGTYGLYADAYRELAKELGILPRELQSITWEAARSLFPDVFKTHANAKIVDEIWRQAQHGAITPDQARAEIVRHATKGQGIPNPDWFRPAGRLDAQAQHSANAEELSGFRIPDRHPEGLGGRTRGAIAVRDPVLNFKRGGRIIGRRQRVAAILARHGHG